VPQPHAAAASGERERVRGVPILPCVWRAAIFAIAGLLLCVRSLQTFTDPEFTDPVSISDWFAVLSFSAALLVLALALPMFAQLVGGPAVFRVALVPAVGAALAGLGNLLEDALQLGFAFWLFIVGTTITLIGLVSLSIAVAVVGRGRRRLLAAVPAATLIGMLLFESGGGVLILAAWLAAAAVALGGRVHAAAQTAPTRP